MYYEQQQRPGMVRAPLSPMAISDMLDEAFRLLRGNVALLVGIVALILIPAVIASAIATAPFSASFARHGRELNDVLISIQNGTAPDSALTTPLSNVMRDGAHMLLVIVPLSILAGSLFSSALFVAVSQRYLDRPVTLAQCLSAALRRLVPLVGTLLTFGLLLGAGLLVPALLAALAGSSGLGVVLFMLSLLVVVYIAVRGALLVQVVTVESHGLRALKRSFALTHGSWWRTFGVLAITSLALFLVTGFVSSVDTRIFSATPLVATILNVSLTIVLEPIVLGTQTLLYYDLRVRKEGYAREAMVTQLNTLLHTYPEGR